MDEVFIYIIVHNACIMYVFTIFLTNSIKSSKTLDLAPFI